MRSSLPAGLSGPMVIFVGCSLGGRWVRRRTALLGREAGGGGSFCGLSLRRVLGLRLPRAVCPDGHLPAVIGTLAAIISTLTAIIGTLTAIIGTLTAIIGTLAAVIGTLAAVIGTFTAVILSRNAPSLRENEHKSARARPCPVTTHTNPPCARPR